MNQISRLLAIIGMIIFLFPTYKLDAQYQKDSLNIKKDNPYDNQLSDKPNDFDDYYSSVNDAYRLIRETPYYGGSMVDPTLGKSQYDESIPWRDLMNESVSNIRAERRNEQIKSVLTIILTVGIIFFVVFFLIRTSKKDSHKNNLL